MIKIKKIVLHILQMRLKAPFSTSYGDIHDRELLIVEVKDDDGAAGFGEGVAFSIPWYTEETVKTTVHMIEDFLIPILSKTSFHHPRELAESFRFIRRNYMAKAALEGAVWDLYAKQQNIPLSQALGGMKKEVEAGVSIGIQPTIKDLISLIEQYQEEGYKRVKIKIKPGWDIEVVKEIRKHFPNLDLMADANSAYTLKDINHLKQLDEFQLMMIEQPLAYDDIVDHSKLQKELETPICLDESICSFEDARKAVELRSCKIMNIKIGRVGGLTEAKKIHDFCKEQNVPVWCGGMLESGIGRAHNISLATLEQFTLPGDISSSSKYWEEDIIEPEMSVYNGKIALPDNPGIGFHVSREKLKKYTVETKVFTL